MNRRSFLFSLACAGTASAGSLAGCLSPPDGGNGDGSASVSLETFARGFDAPLDFDVAAESANRVFVADQTGEVHAYYPDENRTETFLDISGSLASARGEMGLLGVAFHPGFGNSDNRRFYVRYSAPSERQGYNHTFVLSEFRANEDMTQARRGSERRLLTIPEPQSNHNSGSIVFGPEGYLYVGVGDGGAAGDTGNG
ncbi:MAG: PQQ-dependent sugar dehydrogenase, partial [Halobacteria archaeon]|nr:PQQ-dependent sugar dehydrogenase [Halobacteria archaeon]